MFISNRKNKREVEKHGEKMQELWDTLKSMSLAYLRKKSYRLGAQKTSSLKQQKSPQSLGSEYPGTRSIRTSNTHDLRSTSP